MAFKMNNPFKQKQKASTGKLMSLEQAHPKTAKYLKDRAKCEKGGGTWDHKTNTCITKLKKDE